MSRESCWLPRISPEIMADLPRMASRRGGVLFKLMLMLAGGCALAALAWMMLLPYVVASQLRQRTGFDVAFQALMFNPFTGEIRARGLAVNNPPTFPQPEFLQIRACDATVDMLSLFSDRPVIDRLSLDIGQVALVKRADGQTNMDVFRGYLGNEKAAPKIDPAKPAADAFLIKQLHVRFDRLLLADYTHREPVRREYEVKLDRSFTHVTDSRELLLPDSLNQLFAIGGAVGSLLPEEVNRVLDEVLRSGKDLLKRVPRPNTEALRGYTDALEESKKP